MAIIVTIEMTTEVWDTSRDTSIGTTRSVLTKSFDESAGQGRAAAYTASCSLVQHVTVRVQDAGHVASRP